VGLVSKLTVSVFRGARFFIHEFYRGKVIGKGLSAGVHSGANKTDCWGIASKLPMRFFRCIFVLFIFRI